LNFFYLLIVGSIAIAFETHKLIKQNIKIVQPKETFY